MNVMWFIPVLGRILFANGFFPLILKRNVGLHSRTKRFSLQYLFCVILVIAAALTFMKVTWGGFAFAIMALGFFNGLAAYCQWRAIDISLSKTSVFTFWDDIIAMALSFFILHEGRFLNTGVQIGLILSFGAVILFALNRYRIAASEERQRTDGRFLWYVLTYSLIWGFAMFFMKFSGLNGVTTGTFLMAWYIGSFLAALVLLSLYQEKPSAKQERLKAKDVIWMFLLSLSIMTALVLSYWSYKLAPQNVVQPLFLIGEMIIPTLIGLYVFREVKNLSKSEKLYFVSAVAGGLFIALSFSP